MSLINEIYNESPTKAKSRLKIIDNGFNLFAENLNFYLLVFFSCIITFIFAYFSWHLVEKQALKLKKNKFNLNIYRNYFNYNFDNSVRFIAFISWIG